MSRRKSGGGTMTVACVIAGVVLASGAHHAAKHRGAILDSDRAIPAAASYTPASWARAILRATGEPETSCDVSFMIAWENAEGGNWHNGATANPLDTTEPEPGAYDINSVHVKAYKSWHEGLVATRATLLNGNYGGILAALSNGHDPQAAADAVAASPWGTEAFTASC